MTLALIITLFVVGFVLIGVELLVTPGFVVGLIGMGFLAAGIYVIYTEYGNQAGTITLITVATCLIVFFVVSLRSGFWSRIASKDQITGKANKMDQISLEIGAEGTAISALRPSGYALFNHQKFEVQTDGEFIDSSVIVIVTSISDNKITVKPKTT
ncbi:MAG: hypothetical protein JXR19_04780 [Bacteroidia bacterium]